MPPDADFSFTINFEKGAGDPKRVFDAASELIAGFESLDSTVAASVDSKIKTVMVLEDVETGSLRVFLKNALKRVDDEAIKSLEWKKAVGAALVRAKYIALEFLDGQGATGGDAIDKLLTGLRQIAQETDIRHLPDYPPIHEGRLVSSLDMIQDAKSLLGPGDKLTIQSNGMVYEVDLSKTWSPARTIPTKPMRETHSEGEIILGIRKPDLLGEAMWQFSHGKVKLSASISDEPWLAKFHDRQIALYSGDGMRCRVRFSYIYDESGELLDQKTEVVEVLEIIRSGGSQVGFDFSGA